MLVSDSKNRIIAINAAAERILNAPRQHILGRPLECLAAYTTPDSEADWNTIARSNSPLQLVFESENSIVHVHAAPALTSDGDRHGVVVVLRDVTGETETERAMSEFVAAISHELRDPITTIQGYAEALRGGLAGTVSESQSNLLDIIHDNTLRIIMLTENLTTVSQIETGSLKLEYGEANLHTLADAVVDSFRGQLEARQLNVSLELDENISRIEADPARVRQMLYNLLSNAIKFTYPGGHITIGAKPLDGEEHPQPHCAIRVSDTGIGIPPKEQAHVWERFYRSTAPPAAESSGLGVGLAIVKSLAEAHGGRAWVQSTPGEGSTFTISLPIKRAGG